jgi:hypothetical protein
MFVIKSPTAEYSFPARAHTMREALSDALIQLAMNGGPFKQIFIQLNDKDNQPQSALMMPLDELDFDRSEVIFDQLSGYMAPQKLKTRQHMWEKYCELLKKVVDQPHANI